MNLEENLPQNEPAISQGDYPEDDLEVIKDDQGGGGGSQQPPSQPPKGGGKGKGKGKPGNQPGGDQQPGGDEEPGGDQQPGGDGFGGDDGPPSPDGVNIDAEELRQRMLNFMNYVFNFGNFAKSFFDFDWKTFDALFIDEKHLAYLKFKLALARIYQKNVYTSKVKDKEADDLLKLIRKIDPTSEFIRDFVNHDNFKISTDAIFKIKIEGNPQMMAFFFTTMLMEGNGRFPDFDTLSSLNLGDDNPSELSGESGPFIAPGVNVIGDASNVNMNLEFGSTVARMLSFLENLSIVNSNENPIMFAQCILVKMMLDKYESFLVDDYAFYRFLSLNMFAEPQLYQDDWFEKHLNNIFEFYNARKLPFTNLKPYSYFFSIDDFENKISDALNTYNFNLTLYNFVKKDFIPKADVIVKADKHEYTIYKVQNVKLHTGASIDTKMIVEKKDLKNLEFVDKFIISLDFYDFYMNISSNLGKDRVESYNNLQKIFNLQQDSYTDFLRRINLETYLQYGI